MNYIIGCGGVGSGAIQGARIAGARHIILGPPFGACRFKWTAEAKPILVSHCRAQKAPRLKLRHEQL